MDKKPLLHIDRKKVRKHYGKSDSEVEAIIKVLKEWIKSKDFPEMTNDHNIEFFLTNCKYNLETTKQNIETYYGIRNKVPEIYKNSNPKSPEIQEAWNMGCYLPLPISLKGLYRICIVNLNNPESGKFNAYKYFANFMNIFEVRICEDLVLSQIIIVDYKQLTWSHIFKFSPFLLRKMIYLAETVAKGRLKQIHVIQSPYYVTTLINMGKKFMKKKMADRIQVHKDMESLYDLVPRELLPSDYGGKQASIKELTATWKNKVEEYQDRFDMWEKISKEEE